MFFIILSQGFLIVPSDLIALAHKTSLVFTDDVRSNRPTLFLKIVSRDNLILLEPGHIVTVEIDSHIYVI